MYTYIHTYILILILRYNINTHINTYILTFIQTAGVSNSMWIFLHNLLILVISTCMISFLFLSLYLLYLLYLFYLLYLLYLISLLYTLVRSAMREGATHVLVLRTRPDPCEVKPYCNL